MKKILAVLAVLFLVFCVLVLAAILLVPRFTKLDPIAVVGDAVTGYGANSDRHKNAQQLPTPWDPIGDANRRVEAIPMEDRAYPLIAEAAAMLEAADVNDLLRNEPGEEGWEETVAWVRSEEAQKIIELFDEAAAKPHLGAPMSDAPIPMWESARERHGMTPETGTPSKQPLILDVLIPHIGALRKAVSLLLIDAELAVQAGNPDRFVEKTLIAIDLVRMSTEYPMLIEILVRYANMFKVHEFVGRVLAESPDFIGENHASVLADRFQTIADSGLLVLDLAQETAMSEDVLRRFMDPNGVFDPASARRTADGFDTAGGMLIGPSSVVRASMHPSVADAIQKLEDWRLDAMQRTSMPFQAGPSFSDELEAYVSESSGLPGLLSRLILSILVPDYGRLVAIARMSEHYITGFRVALAAHRHRLRHGDPPMGISDIDDDLMPFEAIDGFTGGPMQLRWRDGAPFVYTYGPDKDDDGGVHVPDRADGEAWRGIPDALIEEAPDGDFVLFPVPEE